MLLSSMINDSFKALDEAYGRYRTFILAYSGGKDSTAVAILLYKWVKDRRPKDLEVVILHNDTLSEVPGMENWARKFIKEYADKMSRLGVEVIVDVASPRPTDTFYWRVFVRGYPAPTFNFRWCVELLKIVPTKQSLARYGNYILVVGSRDEESAARAKSMRVRFGSCMRTGSCLGAYFAVSNDIPKVAPIRFWSTEEVWAFLKAQRDFNVTDLVQLYLFNGNLGVRYGCWHCTLARVQQGLYLKPQYLYVEALRLIYRAVSDIPELRTPKSGGYSVLGPLNAVGRAVILNAIPTVEELIGGRFFYGLDEARLDGVTLRELFYELPPREADEIIRKYDDSGRQVPMEVLREGALGSVSKYVEQILNRVDALMAKGNPYRQEIIMRASEILNRVSN